MTDQEKALAKYFINEEGENARNAIIRAKEEQEDYLVLTDEEADEKAEEYILDSVWSFNYNFLISHSEAISNMPQKEYEAMAGKLCESFNEAVLAMIDDIPSFVQDAICSDGRGHFLSPYDGEEYREEVDNMAYFIYRQN